MNSVYLADSISVLNNITPESVDMIYTDPPFGTGITQKRQRHIDQQILPKMSYNDRFDNYVDFLKPYLEAMFCVLKASGTMYLHLDSRWVHYAKVEADKIFGYDNFLNEIVWAYDFGGRGKNRWPPKHDTILVYTKEKGKHIFNWDSIDRIPYMAPALQKDPLRLAKGKVPTDVWWMSIVGTQSKERTGYPSQKPVKLIERAIEASSNPGCLILDPFCGSGTTGVAASNLKRNFTLIDSNPQAINIVASRLTKIGEQFNLY